MHQSLTLYYTHAVTATNSWISVARARKLINVLYNTRAHTISLTHTHALHIVTWKFSSAARARILQRAFDLYVAGFSPRRGVLFCFEEKERKRQWCVIAMQRARRERPFIAFGAPFIYIYIYIYTHTYIHRMRERAWKNEQRRCYCNYS